MVNEKNAATKSDSQLRNCVAAKCMLAIAEVLVLCRDNFLTEEP